MSGAMIGWMMAAALAGAQSQVQEQPTQLEDITVTAQRRADAARSFVRQVAAPPRGRGLGRWTAVCPAIVNLDRAVAQPIVDRMAQVAVDIGIRVQDPGCEANIVVIFARDARGLANAMADSDRRLFTQGGNGIDRGAAALRDFREGDQPVRWWSLSVPIDSQTGQRAVRVPGDRVGGSNPRLAAMLGCTTNPSDCVGVGAPIVQSFSASRLSTQVVDQLYKSIVIVDMDAVSGLSSLQLADYLAMVTLSQIDPRGQTSGFETVLNLFADPNGVEGLTNWDRAYLTSLYKAQSRRQSPGAQATAVADLMYRSTLAGRDVAR